MPNFDIFVDGKLYHVEVPDPGASPLQVIVDGQTFLVNVGGSGPQPVPARQAPAPPPAPAPAVLPTPKRVPIAQPVKPIGSNGDHEIIAPMPGTILSVDVKVGAAVTAGQTVCVLEAMKMKNPIRANLAGTVTEVAVQPGQSVAYGDLLVKLA